MARVPIIIISMFLVYIIFFGIMFLLMTIGGAGEFIEIDVPQIDVDPVEAMQCSIINLFCAFDYISGTFSWLFSLFSLNSEVIWINVLIVIPFIIILGLLILFVFRDMLPF